MKIYFTYENKTREGCESVVPLTTGNYESESIEEISGESVLEKVENLPRFLDECYRLLKPGGKAVFSSFYYASVQAWQSPLTKRGISETSLSFADKKWREQNNFSEVDCKCDFEIQASFAIDPSVEKERSEAAKLFWLGKFNNVVQAVLFTLTKRNP